MQQNAKRKTGGAHRKQTVSPAAKSRVALLAMATGAVSTAGAGGAAAAHAQANTTENHSIELASDASSSSIPLDAAPQILSISEFKPVSNLSEQLTKAIHYNEERVAADEAARAPQGRTNARHLHLPLRPPLGHNAQRH